MAYNKVETLISNVKWSEISNAIEKDGRVRLADYAEKYGVSIPTMRKLFQQKYGVEIEFRRGRTGGVFPTKKWQNVENDTSNAEEDSQEVVSVKYSPDADSSVEAQVDKILGVES